MATSVFPTPVDAYWLTDEDGNATDVYIFQNDRLIDKLEDVGTFNTPMPSRQMRTKKYSSLSRRR